MKFLNILFALAVTAGVVQASSPEVRLPAQVQRMDMSAAEGIAILSGGRIKPLLVAAREGVQEIRGKASLGSGLDAMQSWFALALYADTLSKQPVILCEHKPLRQAIGLSPEGRWASFDELAANTKLRQLVESADLKDKDKIRLTAEEKAARAVARRLEKFESAKQGMEWRLLPGPKGDEGHWRLPQEVGVQEASGQTGLVERAEAFRSLLLSFAKGDQETFDQAAKRLGRNELLTDSGLRLAQGQAVHTRAFHVRTELLLVHLRPFRWTWVLLTLGFLLAYSANVAVGQGRSAKWLTRLAGGVSVSALLIMVVGFAMRVLVSGRAPVTNMYETTLWVGFGSVLFGLPIALLYRSRIVLMCVSVAGALVFALADNLPSVLDPSIRPLVPVLRSNYWLTIHVLTVTISYAAFLVAMAIGNLGIFLSFRRANPEFQKQLAHYAYRAMQLGIFLLTSGIILGGVWADYSWGRFWGWDPKETWALIADLGYLIVLHGRFTGWIRTFGTLMGAVLGFYGVVMAWYGVNFILASGLHSYGFSEGGAAAMGVYVVVQGTFAGLCWWKYSRTHAVN